MFDMELSFSSCVGRIFDIREYPLHVLRLLLKKVWKFEKLLVIKIWMNVIQIFFTDVENMEKIMRGGPWCLDNHLLALQRWERVKEFTDASFNGIFFWIHVGGLPENVTPRRWDARWQVNLGAVANSKFVKEQRKNRALCFKSELKSMLRNLFLEASN